MIFETLYKEGFIKIEDIQHTDTVLEYFNNLNNYKESLLDGRISCLEALELPISIVHTLNTSIKNLKLIPKKWMARNVGLGFSLLPHVEHILDESNNNPYDSKNSPATICLYISPPKFVGREFVYGEIKNIEIYKKSAYFTYPYTTWDDPSLIIKGKIIPITGQGVIIDRTNPKWWHGVTALKTDCRIISILGIL